VVVVLLLVLSSGSSHLRTGGPPGRCLRFYIDECALLQLQPRGRAVWHEAGHAIRSRCLADTPPAWL
jgi:hypothetical protein